MNQNNNDFMAKISERLLKIETTLVAIQKDLSYHIKRTDLLDERMTIDKAAIKDEIRPIKTHILKVQILFAVLALIPILVGVAVGVKKLFF